MGDGEVGVLRNGEWGVGDTEEGKGGYSVFHFIFFI